MYYSSKLPSIIPLNIIFVSVFLLLSCFVLNLVRLSCSSIATCTGTQPMLLRLLSCADLNWNSPRSVVVVGLFCCAQIAALCRLSLVSVPIFEPSKTFCSCRVSNIPAKKTQLDYYNGGYSLRVQIVINTDWYEPSPDLDSMLPSLNAFPATSATKPTQKLIPSESRLIGIMVFHLRTAECIDFLFKEFRNRKAKESLKSSAASLTEKNTKLRSRQP